MFWGRSWSECFSPVFGPCSGVCSLKDRRGLQIIPDQGDLDLPMCLWLCFICKLRQLLSLYSLTSHGRLHILCSPGLGGIPSVFTPCYSQCTHCYPATQLLHTLSCFSVSYITILWHTPLPWYEITMIEDLIDYTTIHPAGRQSLLHPSGPSKVQSEHNASDQQELSHQTFLQPTRAADIP